VSEPSPAPVAPATDAAIASPDRGPGDDRFARLTHFGGFDWGGAEHQFVAVDPAGRIVVSLRFANDAQGWALFRQKVAALPPAAARPSSGWSTRASRSTR
jgi:hypothetical protein